MRTLMFAAAALLSASPAAAIVTISFSGSNNGHNVTGFIRYDETQAPTTTSSSQNSTSATYVQDPARGFVFSFDANGLSRTFAYDVVVTRGVPGGQVPDVIGAQAFPVPAESALFFITYPPGSTLTSNALPTAPPPGGQSRFIYNRDGFPQILVDVTWVAQVTPVPEPATWAMLITGFGMMGGAIRARGRRLDLDRSKLNQLGS